MIEYVGISAIAILLNLFCHKNKNILEFSFLLLTIFFAIRFEFGNDYATYFTHFYIDSELSWQEGFEYSSFEIGWVLLCKLFKPIGFYGMVIALTIFEQYTIYRFVKKYVPEKLYWLALFIFLFTPGLCLTGLSMMRQYLAMCICLYAFEIATKFSIKNLFISIGFIYFASQFHSSALVCIPLTLVGLLNNDRLTTFKSVTLFATLLLGGLVLAKSFGYYFSIYSQSLGVDKYEGYIGREDHSIFGISDIVTYSIALFILLRQKAFDSGTVRKLSIICVLFVLMDMIKPVAPMVGRIGLYFLLLLPFSLPQAFSVKRGDAIALPLLAVYIIVRLYNYYSFVTSAGWGSTFYEYKTIFSTGCWQ